MEISGYDVERDGDALVLNATDHRIENCSELEDMFAVIRGMAGIGATPVDLVVQAICEMDAEQQADLAKRLEDMREREIPW